MTTFTKKKVAISSTMNVYQYKDSPSQIITGADEDGLTVASGSVAGQRRAIPG